MSNKGKAFLVLLVTLACSWVLIAWAIAEVL